MLTQGNRPERKIFFGWWTVIVTGILSGLGHGFDTHHDPERDAQVADVPPGEYKIYWRPDGGIAGSQSWDAVVSSGKTTEISVDLEPPIVLTIDPCLPTGGEARELALEVAVYRERRWSARSMANGCVEGPERIQIAPEYKGKIRVIAHKEGYEKVTEDLEIGDEDLTWSPVLKAIPSER